MKRVQTIDAVRREVKIAKEAGREIAFVPTMGYLHQGHLSLVERASRRGAFVVVSVFVNPTQFGESEDFEKYPRNEERDRRLLEERGVDLLFQPDVAEIYPAGFSTRVVVENVSEPLEGTFRPGHFEGVATVVARLLNIVQPDVAIFGQKDAQQCAVVKRLVSDLAFPVEVEVGEIIRESDGLAMSSRNVRLTEEERRRSVGLFRALHRGLDCWSAGRGLDETEKEMKQMAEDHGLEVEYLRVVDEYTFEQPDSDGTALGVGAVRVGAVRLIDNLKFGEGSSQ